MKKHKSYESLALRIGLGLFLLIWGIAKFTQKGMWLKKYTMFYGSSVGAGLLSTIGTIQIIIALMLIFGWKCKFAALIGGLMHLSTTIVTLKQILHPYTVVEGMPPFILFFSAVPILAGFIALWYLGAGSCSLDNKK